MNLLILVFRKHCDVYNLLGMVEIITTKSMFHVTAEELRELDKENDIKLLGLLEYIKKRSNKKIQKKGLTD